MRISDDTLDLIEEQAFFNDIPMDRLLKIYEQAYRDPPPAHMSREQYALNRVLSLVKEGTTKFIPSKSLSVIKRLLDEEVKRLFHASKIEQLKGGRFRPMSHFGTKQAARDRSRFGGDEMKSYHGANVDLGKSFNADDIGNHHPMVLATHLHRKGMFDDKEHRQLQDIFKRVEKKHYDREKERNPPDVVSQMNGRKAAAKSEARVNNRILARAIKKKGYDSIQYKNNTEDMGSTSHIITNHNQIKKLKSKKAITGWLKN